MEHGNKIYNSIAELQKDIGIRANVRQGNIRQPKSDVTIL